MLLVDDGETEVLELDRVLDEGVRADGDGGAALFQIGQNLLAQRLPLPADEEADLDAERLEVLLEIRVVLLGEDLGRRHERALEAGVERLHHRRDGDDGLAAADVALDEPVHLPPGHRVVRDVLDGAELRAGEREREHVVDEPPGVVAGRAERRAGHVLPLLVREREQELEEEQLLELQPPLRPAEFARVFREVDRAEGDVAGDEVVALAHPLRQHFGDLEPVLFDEPVDQPPERPAVEPDFVERRAAGVERDDPARVERRALGVELVEVGVGHRERAAVLLGLAVEGHALFGLKQAVDVIGAAEPHALQRPAALVLHEELEPLLAAAPGHEVLRLHEPDDGDGLAARGELADRRHRRAVEVAAGIGAEEVAERLRARLAQRVRAPRADAWQVGDVGIEDGHGAAGAGRRETGGNIKSARTAVCHSPAANRGGLTPPPEPPKLEARSPAPLSHRRAR